MCARHDACCSTGPSDVLGRCDRRGEAHRFDIEYFEQMCVSKKATITEAREHGITILVV